MPAFVLFLASVAPLAASEPSGSFEGVLIQLGSTGLFLALAAFFGRSFFRKSAQKPSEES